MPVRIKRSKYNNYKVLYRNMLFDSKGELLRFKFLEESLSRKKISNLQRQVIYTIHEGYSYYNHFKMKTIRVGAIKYIADFVYNYKGYIIIEDFKGKKTEIFKLKEKMLLARLNENQLFYTSNIKTIHMLPPNLTNRQINKA